MDIFPQLNIKASTISICSLAFLSVLAVYIVSLRQDMVYFVPDANFNHKRTATIEDKSAHESDTPDKQHLEYTNTDSHDYFRSSITTMVTTSANYLKPRMDMVKLIDKYKQQRNNLSSRTVIPVQDESINIIDDQSKDNGNMVPNQHPLSKKYPPEQKLRLDRIRKTCNDHELLSNNIYKGMNHSNYYYTPSYNFSYCKVPKSGSTFWTQVFNILKHGANYSDIVFAQKRKYVHTKMGGFNVGFRSNFRRSSLSILISRDPYSRLYSAYIDKSYLLLSNTNSKIKHHFSLNVSCPIHISFQEFLDYTVVKVQHGRTLNPHWAPIYSICRPCDVNAYMLVKQESFSDDVEQTLRAFGVEEDKMTVILRALHDHRVNTTIPGIINTVYDNLKHVRNIRHCMDTKRLAQRLWTSFKIQGYVNKTLKFPSEKFVLSQQYDDKNHLSRVILDAIETHPMSSEERKTQRKEALVHAYSTIKPSTLYAIRKVYEVDFEMFNYTTEFPNM